MNDYAKRKVSELYSLATGEYIDGWKDNGELKKRWLRTARSVLKAMAKEMGIQKPGIRTNKAGPAVAGDVHLIGYWPNGKGVYISMSDPHILGSYDGPWFIYRESFPDDKYGSGLRGHNRNTSYKALANNPEGLCEQIVNDIAKRTVL